MNATSKNIEMDLIEVFDKDILDFLSRRHHTSVDNIVRQFLKQSNIDKTDEAEYGFALEANEVEILRDYYLQGVPVN